MSGDHFEKQVQQKMAEFMIQPSEPVWGEVEKQIKKRKDRRRLILWLPMLLLLLAGSAWWWLSTNTNKGLTNDRQIQLAGKPIQSTKAIEPGQAFFKDNHSTAKNEEVNKINTHKQKTYNESPGINKLKDSHNLVRSQIKKIAIKTNNNPEVTTTDEKIGSGSAYDRLALPKAEIPDNNSRPYFESGEQDRQLIIPTVITLVKEPLRKQINIAFGISAYPLSTLSVSNLVNLKIKRPLEYGVTLEVGASNISNAFFSGLFDKALADASYNYAASTPATVANRPSANNNGPAFTAGVFARKKIGKHLLFFTGLNYSFFSTTMQVGEKVDSSAAVRQGSLGTQTISSYYSNSSATTQNYTNRFYRLEIPLGIEKQWGNKSRFTLTSGVTISYLLASNFLHYDAQKNIYYRDSRLLNKMQIDASAGIYYSLLRRKEYTIQLGPEFRYGITNLLNKEIYGSRHFIFAGMAAKVLLHKK